MNIHASMLFGILFCFGFAAGRAGAASARPAPLSPAGFSQTRADSAERARMIAELHAAADAGDFDRLMAVLKADSALVNVPDMSGMTPLYTAALGGHKEIIQLLLASGAPEDMYVDAILGSVEKVSGYLKKEMALLNTPGPFGKTALVWAVMFGNVEMVQFLLDKEANVNIADQERFTPLHWAAMYDQKDIAEMLLKKKADVNAQDSHNWSPLRIAVVHNQPEVAGLLLNNGADPNIKDNSETFPLHEAAMLGYTEMVRLLVEHGAKVNCRDLNDETPLTLAREKGFPDITKILKEHGGIE